MKAIKIDPKQQSVQAIELRGKNDDERLQDMHRIIGCDTLGFQTVSREHDVLYVDDGGLKRGEPIHGFLLPVQKEPYAGIAIIIGADRNGKTRSASSQLLHSIRSDIVWLGLIRPEVVWDGEGGHMRAIVTYSKVKQS